MPVCDVNDRKNNNCVLNSTVGAREDDETIVLPPGQIVPADKQCQLVYGSDSFYCAVSPTCVSHAMPLFFTSLLLGSM